MADLQMIPRHQPLCYRHFAQFTERIAMAGKQVPNEEPRVTISPKPSKANKRKAADSHYPTRIQPDRAAKKRVCYKLSGRSSEVKEEKAQASHAAPRSEIKEKHRPKPVQTWNVTKYFTTMLGKSAVRGNGTPVPCLLKGSSMPSETPLEDMDESPASVIKDRLANGYDPLPTIKHEVYWALTRELRLRPEPGHCIFGPKPWVCRRCREEQIQWRQGYLAVVLNGGPTVDVAGQLAIEEAAAQRPCWENLKVPLERQILLGGMSFVVDACGQPMVLRVR